MSDEEKPDDTAGAPPEEEAPAEEEAAATEPAEGEAAEGEEEKKEEDAAEEGDEEKKEEGEEGGEDAAEGDEAAADGEKAEPEEKGPSEIAQRIESDPTELHFLDPYRHLPEKVELHEIPKINGSRSVWRLGMRKLEETFAEHIANMHLDFENKALEYEKIQHKLETNLKFLEGFYVDMQHVLNEKYASIKVERDEWEGEKEEIRSLVRLDSEVIKLNIGGTHHLQTEKDVLRSVPGSTLAKMFSDMHELKKVDEEVFLDRDGRTFESLVNYLRNDRKVFPEFTEKNSENHFYKELHFWGIDSHNRKWHESILKRLDKSFMPGMGLDDSATPGDYDDSQAMSGSEAQISTPTLRKKSTITNFEHMGCHDGGRNRRASDSQSGVDSMEDESRSDLEQPSYLASSAGGASGMDDEEDDQQPGAARRAVKEKWGELGPLKLEEIIANSAEPIDQTLQFGQSQYNKFIIGQLGADGRVQGVGKEINHIIYEGQFKNDIYHGYGRYIYANGNFYIGQWVDGKRSGWGKLVEAKTGRVYEGLWSYSKFLGQ